MGRFQVVGKMDVYFHPDLLGYPGVHSVEGVSSGNIAEDFVIEFFSVSFQRFDKVFHFKDIDIIVVGIGMDEEGVFRNFDVFHAGDLRLYSSTFS